MANNQYSYPRVTMSTTANRHSHNRVNVPDTTVMFAPLVTEKGPDDRLVKVHSLNEFINTFGSMDKKFYEWNGQMALNVYNWLNNGGTLYVKRLIADNSEKAVCNMNFQELIKEYIVNEASKSNSEIKATNFSIDENLVCSHNAGETLLYVEKRDGVATIKSCSEGGFKRSINGYEFIEGEKCYKNTNNETLDLIEFCKEDNNNNADYFVVSENGVYRLYAHNVQHTDNSLKEFKEFDISARYYGEYYNDIYLQIEARSTAGYFNFRIFKESSSGRALEQFLALKLDKCLAALESSEYIKIEGSNGFLEYLESIEAGKTITLSLSGTADSNSYSNTLSLLETFWGAVPEDDKDSENYKKYAAYYLSNSLETPIDIVFDAGYPIEIKKSLVDFMGNLADNPTRPDIILILDRYSLNEKLFLNTPSDNGMDDFIENSYIQDKTTNVALYEQYFTINEPAFAEQNIYVTPTYFLSKLIIYNDLTYGLQYPTAGVRRGILDDVLYVNENPDADTKESWFQKRINYAERTSRETAFMSQRVMDGSNDYDYTALSFLHNSRVLEKMKKELINIGRTYLQELNDAATIAKMNTALNKYVANWIANRTLSLATVKVDPNEENPDNALDINLNIRFTNTIEIINVSIVIE